MSYVRYRAFTTADGGGNPAGVVFDASAMIDREMLALAAELGYSETAFLSPIGEREYRIRYFSPQAEVDFCGHATVAASVALAEHRYGPADLLLHSKVGKIPVTIDEGLHGLRATLTTVAPDVASLDERAELLSLVGWEESDLDPDLPSGLAFGGLWHPLLWAGSRTRLAALDYHFEGLRSLMLRKGWGTVSLLFRESPALVHSRNAFPIGGVVEDPATGAAAGALGGFLRAYGLVPENGRFTVMQGEDMGQPCLLEVNALGEAGIRVSGFTQPIPE